MRRISLRLFRRATLLLLIGCSGDSAPLLEAIFEQEKIQFSYAQEEVRLEIDDTLELSLHQYDHIAHPLSNCHATSNLPEGFTIVSETCFIHGIVKEIFSNRAVRIKAVTEGRELETSITFEVTPGRPELHFSSSVYDFPKNEAKVVSPLEIDLKGAITSSCQSEPILPAGLEMNSACEISGVATNVNLTPQEFKITLDNNAHTVTSNLTLRFIPGTPELIYPSQTKEFLLAEESSLSPSKFNLKGGTISECSITPGLPEGLSINSECIISGKAIQSLSEGAFTITLSNQYKSTEAQVYLKIPELDEDDFLPPATPVPTAKYYKTAVLGADSNYFATFDATGIRFINASNPFELDQIIYLNTLAHGQPQTLASVGEFIFMATTTGRLLTFDWTDREDPHHSNTYILPNTNQYYDMTTDEVGTLFLANTSSQHLAIVSVDDPDNPALVSTHALGGLGSGVAYENGFVYVANYSTHNIHVFSYNSTTNEWSSVDTVSTVNNPARLSIKNGTLAVHRYGGKQLHLFSINSVTGLPENPELLEFEENIGIYARSVFFLNYLLIGQTNGITVLDLSDLSEVKKIIPLDPDSLEFHGILGMNLFRHQSALVFIGSTSNGDIRHVQTIPILLDEILK